MYRVHVAMYTVQGEGGGGGGACGLFDGVGCLEFKCVDEMGFNCGLGVLYSVPTPTQWYLYHAGLSLWEVNHCVLSLCVCVCTRVYVCVRAHAHAHVYVCPQQALCTVFGVLGSAECLECVFQSVCGA